MTKTEILHEVVDQLREFIERASKQGATPEEIAALPEVVGKLMMILDRYE